MKFLYYKHGIFNEKLKKRRVTPPGMCELFLHGGQVMKHSILPLPATELKVTKAKGRSDY